MTVVTPIKENEIKRNVPKRAHHKTTDNFAWIVMLVFVMFLLGLLIAANIFFKHLAEKDTIEVTDTPKKEDSGIPHS